MQVRWIIITVDRDHCNFSGFQITLLAILYTEKLNVYEK